MKTKTIKEILTACEDGLGIHIDRDIIANLYDSYISLFPTLSGTEYMFVQEKENECESIWFFMKENIGIATIQDGKFELFPIKNRITRMVLEELKYADPRSRKGIITISFSFQIDSEKVRTLKEGGSRKKCTYLLRLITDYFLPNLVQGRAWNAYNKSL